MVTTLGLYEFERGISDSERKAKDERLGFAVTLLCKTAGVYEYIAKNVVSEWEAARDRAIAAGMSCPYPPDLSREVLIGLSKYVHSVSSLPIYEANRGHRRLALGDAQNIAVRKLLTRAAFDSVVSPGPPLPKSHPSPALAAKLHLDCVALYSSARALVKTPGASRPSPSHQSSSKSKFKLPGKSGDSSNRDETANDEVVPELRRYLADEIAVHHALAHKWLGVDYGETHEGAGTAVGFLTWSKKELEDLKSGGSSSGINIGSDREKLMREARKARVQDELESVGVFLKGYKRMNDSVSPYLPCSYSIVSSDTYTLIIHRWHFSLYLHKQTYKGSYLQDGWQLHCARMLIQHHPLAQARLSMLERKRKSWSYWVGKKTRRSMTLLLYPQQEVTTTAPNGHITEVPGLLKQFRYF